MLLHKLKSAFHWYLGREKVGPIDLLGEKELLITLDEAASRINRRGWLNNRWLGYFESGYGFYEKEGLTLLKYEPKNMPTYWYYRGKIVNDGGGDKLVGCIKAEIQYEIFRIIILAFVLFGAATLLYTILMGRETDIVDLIIVVGGYPLFLVAVRTMMRPLPWAGAESIAQTKKLLAKIETMHSRPES